MVNKKKKMSQIFEQCDACLSSGPMQEVQLKMLPEESSWLDMLFQDPRFRPFCAVPQF